MVVSKTGTGIPGITFLSLIAETGRENYGKCVDVKKVLVVVIFSYYKVASCMCIGKYENDKISYLERSFQPQRKYSFPFCLLLFLTFLFSTNDISYPAFFYRKRNRNVKMMI